MLSIKKNRKELIPVIVVNIITVVILLVSACTGHTKRERGSEISFETEKFDSLELFVNDTIICEFTFRNTSKRNLKVNDVIPACDCTVAKWSEEILEKNETGVIIAKYSSSFARSFIEYISVYYNGEDSPILLTISGVVHEQLE